LQKLRENKGKEAVKGENFPRSIPTFSIHIRDPGSLKEELGILLPEPLDVF
jgi:hypothetical protein